AARAHRLLGRKAPSAAASAGPLHQHDDRDRAAVTGGRRRRRAGGSIDAAEALCYIARRIRGPSTAVSSGRPHLGMVAELTQIEALPEAGAGSVADLPAEPSRIDHALRDFIDGW